MAKYVIAGKSDCPFYARAEMVADELSLRLPDFSVHKIVLKPDEWDKWLLKLCGERGWSYNGDSPIIWRELINRGGKGILLGGCNDFLEMAKGYYELTCVKSTETLNLITDENEETKKITEKEEQTKLSSKNLFKISVINAHSKISYNLLSHICSGKLNIGTVKNKDISLSLHCVNDDMHDLLDGTKMELQDCAYGELTHVSVETDTKSTFENSDLVIFINESEDLVRNTLQKFKNYALEINRMVNKEAKIVVAGKHAMLTCYVLIHFCTNIPKENFFALSRFEENKIKAALAKRLNIITSCISNVIIWGNSPDFIIDHSFATAKGYEGSVWAPHIGEFSYAINDIIYEKLWLNEELPVTIDALQSKNIADFSLSYSAAILSQLQDLMTPCCSGLFSLGLVSKGWYGIPEGLVFSFPVTYENNKVNVVHDLNVNASMKSKLKEAGEKLQKQCNELLESIN